MQSGHNGGDSILSQDFFALLAGHREASRPGLREGIEASLLSLAADQSVASGPTHSARHAAQPGLFRLFQLEVLAPTAVSQK